MGSSLIPFSALGPSFPTTGAASTGTFGAENIPVCRYSDISDTLIYFTLIMPQFYPAAGNLNVVLNWLSELVTSGNVGWRVQLTRLNPNNQNWGSPAFGSFVDSTPQAVPGVAGVGIQTVITVTGADLQGIQAGDQFAMAITRKTAVSGNAAGFVDLVSGEVQTA